MVLPGMWNADLGIAAATVDGPVTNAEIGETACLVRTHGNIAHDVGHPVVDALIPALTLGRSSPLA